MAEVHTVLHYLSAVRLNLGMTSGSVFYAAMVSAIRLIATTVFGFGLAASALAQDAPPPPPSRTAVMTLGTSLSIDASTQNDCRVSCGLPGSAYGATISVAYWRTPRIAFSVEGVVGVRLRGRQQIRIDGGRIEAETTDEHTVVTPTVQWSLRPMHTRLNAVFVGGGGIAFRETSRGGPFRVVEGSPNRDAWRLQSRAVTPAIVGGVEIPVRLTSRVGVVPSARVHYLVDRDGEYRAHGVGSRWVTVGTSVAVWF